MVEFISYYSDCHSYYGFSFSYYGVVIVTVVFDTAVRTFFCSHHKYFATVGVCYGDALNAMVIVTVTVFMFQFHIVIQC